MARCGEAYSRIDVTGYHHTGATLSPANDQQSCPICGKNQPTNPRYPRYLCGNCVAQANAPDGRRLAFGNVDISGGFTAQYVDDSSPYRSHVCFVKGVACWADEARFGGIVIESIDPKTLQQLINKAGRPVSPSPGTTPCERVDRDDPLSKHTFHARLREWLAASRAAQVGPEDADGRTNWIYVRDGADLFGLHVDTKRRAVERYLELVTLHGDDLEWTVVPSQRGNMSAVAYGPERLRHKSFYLYLTGA